MENALLAYVHFVCTLVVMCMVFYLQTEHREIMDQLAEHTKLLNKLLGVPEVEAA